MPNLIQESETSASLNHSSTLPETETPLVPKEDWSYATQELLDTMPQAWTRGLLYFLMIFIVIVLPWAVFSKIDETGTARGRVEPQEDTVKLDAAVTGTVSEISVKEGDRVQTGQILMRLDTELINNDLKQAQDKLEGQFNRLNELKLLKTQLELSFSTQQQQNNAAELEKQAQIDQIQENIVALTNTYTQLQVEKAAQESQAIATVKNNEAIFRSNEVRLQNAQREISRYRQAASDGVISSSQLAEKEDFTQERQRLYEQSRSDIEQAQLHLKEQKSNNHKAIAQAKSDIEQEKLRLNQQKSSLKSLIHTSELALLKIQEELKNNETDTFALNAEIAQSKTQIQALKFQLSQRSIKATVNGILFQLPIQKAGAVVQIGTRLAEISPQNSPLIVRAQMPTTDSGSLHEGLAVKLKFDAYPFQDYGMQEGKLLKISPTTSLVDTANGKVEVYKLEISLGKNCMQTTNQCIALRSGDTATAEVIVRQRRIIDFVLDPFKKLQKGGLKL